MGRSVVLAGAARCPRCSLPPRWCVCDLLPTVTTRLTVHVLMHRQEQHKPSSTGRLVARAIPGTACHIYQRETRFVPATGFPAHAHQPGRDLWILHPAGAPLPAATAGTAPHVLLLDGTWRQAGEMLRDVERLGRCVRLPDEAAAAPGRYWLREQARPAQRSTAEALIDVLRAASEPEAAGRLRLHFELHVYATLRARGRREMAERYLGHSPLLTDAPHVVHLLERR
jgi:DTW domain-containing protein YfiP